MKIDIIIVYYGLVVNKSSYYDSHKNYTGKLEEEHEILIYHNKATR